MPIWWDDEHAEGLPRHFSLNDLLKMDVEYIQYKSEIEINYDHTFEFLIYQLFRLPNTQIYRMRFQHWISGRKTLVRNERIKVLQHMLARIDDQSSEYASAETLMTEFYGEKWWSAKRAMSHHKYYTLLLKSMVASGDVEDRNGAYKIWGVSPLHT